ncbi:hypothetical protein ACMWQU_26790, partial [Escherichia coli]|uniref:hypothetical protein n=1 Tax=Escherichia coli TaxID=562 RepID=UPI0039E11A0C
ANNSGTKRDTISQITNSNNEGIPKKKSQIHQKKFFFKNPERVLLSKRRWKFSLVEIVRQGQREATSTAHLRARGRE